MVYPTLPHQTRKQKAGNLPNQKIMPPALVAGASFQHFLWLCFMRCWRLWWLHWPSLCMNLTTDRRVFDSLPAETLSNQLLSIYGIPLWHCDSEVMIPFPRFEAHGRQSSTCSPKTLVRLLLSSLPPNKEPDMTRLDGEAQSVHPFQVGLHIGQAKRVQIKLVSKVGTLSETTEMLTKSIWES